jgi:hypothetical protein
MLAWCAPQILVPAAMTAPAGRYPHPQPAALVLWQSPVEQVKPDCISEHMRTMFDDCHGRRWSRKLLLRAAPDLSCIAGCEAVRAERLQQCRVPRSQVHSQQLRVPRHSLHSRPWRAHKLTQYPASVPHPLSNLDSLCWLLTFRCQTQVQTQHVAMVATCHLQHWPASCQHVSGPAAEDGGVFVQCGGHVLPGDACLVHRRRHLRQLLQLGAHLQQSTQQRPIARLQHVVARRVHGSCAEDAVDNTRYWICCFLPHSTRCAGAECCTSQGGWRRVKRSICAMLSPSRSKNSTCMVSGARDEWCATVS